jgi:transposase
VAHETVRLIGLLYDVERQAKDLDADERLVLRGSSSVPVLRQLEELLDREIGRVAPKSPTGRALNYLREEWLALQVFLRHGHAPIDNNAIENAIRPFALGRKNWLFSASPAGARASANLYSLIESAKANGLDPYAYLARVFSALPNANTAADVAALLPYRLV